MTFVEFPATYDGTETVQFVDGQARWLIGLVSGLDDSWEVRGEDDIVPSLSGRIPRNRVRDRLPILLEGTLLGVGETDAEQRSDIRASWEEVRTLFVNTRDPAELSVELEDGSTATILARPLNVVPGPVDLAVVRKVSIQLEAVCDPWDVVAGGS